MKPVTPIPAAIPDVNRITSDLTGTFQTLAQRSLELRTRPLRGSGAKACKRSTLSSTACVDVPHAAGDEPAALNQFVNEHVEH